MTSGTGAYDLLADMLEMKGESSPPHGRGGSTPLLGLHCYLILFFALSVTSAALFDEKEWPWWIVGYSVIAIVFFLWQERFYSQQAEAMAVMEERQRVAREMHDTVRHRLTVAAVQLEAAERLLDRDPARAKETVGVVRERARALGGDFRLEPRSPRGAWAMFMVFCTNVDKNQQM